jgi:hypothetical protein
MTTEVTDARDQHNTDMHSPHSCRYDLFLRVTDTDNYAEYILPKFRRQVAVAQSVLFACGLRATEVLWATR